MVLMRKEHGSHLVAPFSTLVHFKIRLLGIFPHPPIL